MEPRISSVGARWVAENQVAFSLRLRQGEILMTLETRDPARRPILTRLSDAPDLLVIAVWAALVFCVALLRVNFIGDGVRHLIPIVSHTPPSLGEPRWLLFPLFLFAVVKPVQMAGLVHSVKDAARVFLAVDYFAGITYLLLLRQWLLYRSVSSRSRAGALLLAGMTTLLLGFSSDIVEVMVPATIALAGLVYLASRPPESATKGLYLAAAAIAIATLLYQGIVLAVALVPCAIPRDAHVRMRPFILFCAILAIAPLVMFTTIVAIGTSPHTAIHLMLTGEKNVLFRNILASHRPPLLKRPIAAISVGTESSIIHLPDNLGISQGLRLLLHSATFIEGAFNITGRLFALVMVFAGIVVVYRRRDWRIAVGFAGLMILPTVRGYAYLKYYALMPIVVALVASLSPPAVVLGAGVVVATFNLTYLARDFAHDRQLAGDIAPFYASAGTSCWLTTGWGPPLIGWPGSMCSMNQVLAAAHTDQVNAMIAENNRRMTESLRQCFCGSSAVYTDDMTLSSKEAVTYLAGQYRYVGADLTELLWSPAKGSIAFDRDGIVIYTYTRPAQSELCNSLKHRPTDTSH